MNCVLLDNLPRYKEGYNKGKIDWSSSIGMDVEFQYEDIHGYFHIIRYEKEKINIVFSYNDIIYSRTIDNFKKCKLKNIFDSRENKYIYKVGDIFKTKTGQIQIIELARHNGCKAYKYKCLIDGYIGIHTEYDLKNGVGCSVCHGSIVCEGINDLWTTHPDTAKLLKDPMLGYQYSKGSKCKVEWLCPDCDNIIKKEVIDIVQNGLRCNKCGDGFPYGEKFVVSLLSQMKIEFYHRHTFEWGKDKEYDFFIPNNKCIIEVHGKQHYEDSCFGNMKNKTKYIDVHNNDIEKQKLALSNGIEHYIIINVMCSSFNWIKNSILNSELSNIYNLSNVDWILCQTNALKSYVKIVCDLWNEDRFCSIKDISEKINKSTSAVGRWLNQGKELGWCDYGEDCRSNYKLHIEFNGINKTIKEWSMLLDIPYGSIRNRFPKYFNKDPERVLVGMNKNKLALLQKITNELKS